jgi:hypothetical protein
MISDHGSDPMQRTTTRVASLLICGLLLWSVTQFFAMMIGGAGHGWTTPFFATFPLVIIYPLIMIRAFSLHEKNVLLEIVLIVLAIMMNVFVLRSSLEEISYFWKIWGIGKFEIASWIALWVGWQLLTVYSLVRCLKSEA